MKAKPKTRRGIKSFLSTRTAALLITAFIFISTRSNAQVRPDLTSFSSGDRTILVNAMMDHITTGVVEDHCVHQMITGGHIHSDFDFLPFHRMYLERMEDYLIAHGLPQFVPLPKWDPAVTTPVEFQVVDLDCGNANCDPQHPASSCNIGNIWSPGVSLPFYLSTTIQAGSNNDICDWNMDPTWPNPAPGTSGNCCPNGLSRIIEGQGPNPVNSFYHNSVHSLMGNAGGVMGNFRSPAVPAFWVWHAMVDDVWKSWECTCSQSTTDDVDLYMKDNHKVVESERDRGEEPDIDNGPMWLSEDIWVRNLDDGIYGEGINLGTTDPGQQQTQNPEYTNGQPVFVYVRVRNRGCSPSSGTGVGTDILTLNWAKAATSLGWPLLWDGSTNLTCTGGTPVSGGLIGTQLIDVINAGSQDIYRFIWYPPNPADYDQCQNTWANEPWHFCLLARIETAPGPGFGMTVLEGIDLNSNVKENNNIVWKNITVVDMVPGIVHWDPCTKEMIAGGIVGVGNGFGVDEKYDINFKSADVRNATPLHEEAEIKIKLDETTWNKWAEGGYQNDNIRIRDESCRQILVTGNPASIKNLYYDKYERSTIFVTFNFLSDKVTATREFDYHVIQTRSEDASTVGGEAYHIVKHDRYTFLANAGADQTITQGETTILEAEDIGEPAAYNWYDSDGNRISSERRVSVSPDITTEYEVEVIAESDGFKCYDKVIINVQPYGILSVDPNPANTEVKITYRTGDATYAAIQLTQMYGSSTNYDIQPGQHSITINLSDYASGYYYALLVVDGVTIDANLLIVEH